MEYLEAVAGTNGIGQMVANYEHGAWVSVPHRAEYHQSVPADLSKVLDYARGGGCSIVCFDVGGEVYDSLPSYEWPNELGDDERRHRSPSPSM